MKMRRSRSTSSSQPMRLWAKAKAVTSSWARAVDAVLRGDARHYRAVRLGPVPPLLRKYGLGPADMSMSAAKIAKARRDHPQVSREVWHNLPDLLREPEAVFPSVRGDGTVIVVIAVTDRDGNPVIVPIIYDRRANRNAVLSIYGKDGTCRLNPVQWIEAQVNSAIKEGKPAFLKSGSVDSKPKPESADAISWSPDPISVDRSTEPKRKILSIRKESTKN